MRLERRSGKRLRPLALQATAAERAEKLAVEIETLKTRLAAAELERIERRVAEVDERMTSATQDRRRHDLLLFRALPIRL